MTISRDKQGLARQFAMLDDDVLLSRYRSGDLTPEAMEVAAAELGERGIASGDVALAPELAKAMEHDVAGDALAAGGDVVCLARTHSLMDAQILCARLEAEGIAALAGDAELIRTNSFLTQALGGVRILVAAADLTRAREVRAALLRGDFALDDEDVRDPGRA